MHMVSTIFSLRGTALSGLLLALAACGPTSRNAPLVEGPAVEDIVTPYEDALMCLNGKVDTRLSFAVGGIPDQTGREQNSTEGAGRFVTQGAGDIVQSALFKAGVTVINRRDMGSAAMESQWGIRDLKTQRQSNLVITGSINSLDFLPGGGTTLNVRGIGPRYRQHRILVGMDLALTNNATGQVLANIALHKQLFADELGFGGARFIDDRLIEADIGVARREAVHYALRQMLQLATFELLVQLMPPERYVECAETIDPRHGRIRGGRTSGEQLRQHEERLVSQQVQATASSSQAADVGELPLVDEQMSTSAATAEQREYVPASAADAPGQQAAPAQPTAHSQMQLTTAAQLDPSADDVDSATSQPTMPRTDTPVFPVGEPIQNDAPLQVNPGFNTGETDQATGSGATPAPDSDDMALAARPEAAENMADDIDRAAARLEDAADCEEFPFRTATSSIGCQLANVPRHLTVGMARAQ